MLKHNKLNLHWSKVIVGEEKLKKVYKYIKIKIIGKWMVSTQDVYIGKIT